MRATILALLLCVPLLAGDRSSLAEAVELFKSADAAEREAGSQLAQNQEALAQLFARRKDWKRVQILVQRDRKYVYLPPRREARR